jgi:cytochrome c-type biogenesis protein CcmF
MIDPSRLLPALYWIVNVPELGQFCLMLALGLAVTQVVVSVRPSPIGAALAARAHRLGFWAVAAAFVCLIVCAVVSDFSVSAVAQYSHTAKPLFYKISGVWGNHQGSMLLWVLMLSLFGLGVVRASLDMETRCYALAGQGALQTAFLLFIVGASDPLARVFPVPVQGDSLNPLLQDPALAFHPPLLYAGYVGFSAVFAMAAAALITGRVHADWARAVRPVALVAWVCLTLGIALGSYWAYYELGWGGWWFWDPVENASLLPWLSGTALVHALLITQRRGLFPGWTVFLALLTFSLSLLGTFLVRSGVLTSVHAFALDPARGYAVLAILGLFSGGGFVLFALRGADLDGADEPFALSSREGLMMFNNLMLSAACFAVLIGTLYPLLLEGLTGRSISVGAPYFNAVFTPLMAALLLLIPIGLAAPWRHVRKPLSGHIRLLAGVLFAVFIIGVAVLGPHQAGTAFGLALGVWVIAGSVWDAVLRTRGGAGWRLATVAVMVAHLGLGVFVIGAVAESAGRHEASTTMRIGQTVTVDHQVWTLESVGEVDGPNYVAARAVLRGPDGVVLPERRFYPASGQSTTEAAITSHLWGDRYVTIGEPQAGPGDDLVWPVRIARHPLILWVYLGCVLMALGGAVAFWARRSERSW